MRKRNRILLAEIRQLQAELLSVSIDFIIARNDLNQMQAGNALPVEMPDGAFACFTFDEAAQYGNQGNAVEVPLHFKNLN